MVAPKAFLRLVRFQNLLIVALTMILMRYAIIKPIISILPFMVIGSSTPETMILQLAWYDFVILVLSTVCITAAGYVINDYFDIRADLVNRRKIVVGTRIARRKAMMWHNILNVFGIAGGFYVSYKIGYFWLGIIFMLVSGLLYFYSATYKRQLLLGNLIVSLLTALVPMMVVAFEVPPLYSFYSEIAVEMPSLKILFFWVGGFSLFAFIINLIREITKDIEDFEGDNAYGSNTLPVVLGIKGSKVVVLILVVITLVLLYLVWFLKLNDLITLAYITIAVVTPLIVALFYILPGKTKEQFHKGSSWIKIVMLAGICYSLVVLFIITTEVLV